MRYHPLIILCQRNRNMKCFFAVLFSCLVLALTAIVPVSAAPSGGTLVDDARQGPVSVPVDDSIFTRRYLKEAARIEFSDFFPQPGHPTNNRTFSVKVVDLDQKEIDEVKLLYRPRGQDKFKNKEKLKNVGTDNIWALEIEDLDYGSYDWYLEAKNDDKGKKQSAVFTFELADAPPPPTSAPSPVASAQPSVEPSGNPTMQPEPSQTPTQLPSNTPSVEPSGNPTIQPEPSQTTSQHPSAQASLAPSGNPTIQPEPSQPPSQVASAQPSLEPSGNPTVQPEPSQTPSQLPSKTSSTEPTSEPSPEPSKEPTSAPIEPVGPFSQILPPPGLQSTQQTQNFSVQVASLDGEVVSEVKLLYKLQGEDKFDKDKLKYTGANDIWALEMSLPYGSYDWYVEAKTQDKTKIKSIDNGGEVFSFQIADESAAGPRVGPSPSIGGISYGLQANCFNINTNRYDICLDLVGQEEGVVKPWMEAFVDAREAWEQVIVGHVGTFTGIEDDLKSFNRHIGTDGLPTRIDDLYIVGAEVEIDGPYGILGSAGPTLVIDDGSWMPVAGQMRFDAADIVFLESVGAWVDVIKHEMGHVLGIGTLWDVEEKNSRFEYKGAKGIEEWQKQCPSSEYDSPPVESGGGGGTRGGHWDEECFDIMLMTGWLDYDSPLSVLTVAALEDIGFEVSYDTASSQTVVDSLCCTPPNRRRNLRNAGRNLHADNIFDHGKSGKGTKKKKMSEENYKLAAVEAAKELQAARENVPFVPSGLKYVGGDFVTVFALEEDGTISEATFS